MSLIRPMRTRLLRNLNRVFDKEPGLELALRIRSAGGLTWTIADREPGGPRELTVKRPAMADLVLSLEPPQTIVSLRDALAAAGVEIAYYGPPELLLVGALALLTGEGDQDASNGDHLYAYDNPNWAWVESVGRPLDRAAADKDEALRELVIPWSTGRWSELWASYFGLRRRKSETDSSLNTRSVYEWRRPRSNPVAIVVNQKKLLNVDVAVREPWKEMWVLDKSRLDGRDHMPNATEFRYHTAQIVSREFPDWELVMAEAEADRPAGTIYLPPVSRPLWELELLDVPEGVQGSQRARVSGRVDGREWRLDVNLILDESRKRTVAASGGWSIRSEAVAYEPEAMLPWTYTHGDPPLPAGVVAGEAAASGALTTQIRLVGTVAGEAVASANLRISVRLQAAAVAQASASGALRVGVIFGGSAAAVASASAATLTDAASMLAQARAQASATGTLTTAIPLTGFAGTVGIGVSGDDPANSDTPANVGSGPLAIGWMGGMPALLEGFAGPAAGANSDTPANSSIAANDTGGAKASGTLGSLVTLTGVAPAQAVAAGALTARIRFAGTAAGQASASGTLSGGTASNTEYATAGLTVWMRPEATAYRNIIGGAFEGLYDSRDTGAQVGQATAAWRPPLTTLAGRGVVAFGGGQLLGFRGDSSINATTALYRYFDSLRATVSYTVAIRTPDAWPSDGSTFMPIIGTFWWGYAANRRVVALQKIGADWRPAFSVTDITGNDRSLYPTSGGLQPGRVYQVTVTNTGGQVAIYVDGAAQVLNSTGLLPNEGNAHPARGGDIGYCSIANADNYFHGYVLDILIHDGVALSAAQVSANAAVTAARYPAA